uniref:Mitochondrial import inner membrane translocase subunit TIM23 n=1 Tax=Erythrolobus madagascarensis TaxID=708628 RepID=A0A6T9YNV7_9RHOD|mmetsp:Transcript_1227/g.2477  ORF Transcript_1227/g.2477 Transcript_1227/m.2477 type:complete len:251 (+) Transcript_1227:33-785(+)
MSFYGESGRGEDRDGGRSGFEFDSGFMNIDDDDDEKLASYTGGFLNSPPPLSRDSASFAGYGAQTSDSSAPSLNYGNLGAIRGLGASGAFGGGYDSDSLDYLFNEDFLDYRKKTWGEQMTYLGGVSYLTGSLAGGAYGFAEAARASRGKSAKLFVNAALNSVGKRATVAAQGMGVCAIMFSAFESIIYRYRNDDLPENYLAAGALSGMLYKSTRGLKTASLWGVGLASIGCGMVYASRQGMYGSRVQGLL